MKFPSHWLQLSFWTVLTVCGLTNGAAQQTPSSTTIKSSTGEGITYSLLGRNFVLKSGDTIPRGAKVQVPEGSRLVVSPAIGAILVVESRSEVAFVSNDILFAQRSPSSQILVDVISGRVSVSTGMFLNPNSRFSINTPQGLFTANNANFTVATVVKDQDSSPSAMAGVQVTSGNVEAALSSGEQLNLTSGRVMVAVGSGVDLTRSISEGILPAKLTDYRPGESELSAGNDIMTVGRGFPDAQTAQLLSQALGPEIQSTLGEQASSSVPLALVNMDTPLERTVPLNVATGLGGESAPASVEARLNVATSPLIATSLAQAGGFAPPPDPTIGQNPTPQAAFTSLDLLIPTLDGANSINGKPLDVGPDPSAGPQASPPSAPPSTPPATVPITPVTPPVVVGSLTITNGNKSQYFVSQTAPNLISTIYNAAYIDPNTGSVVVSTPIPGYYPPAYWGSGGDALVITSQGGSTQAGSNGLYWPWNNSVLGPALISTGFRPDGDIFAAYYVYTHYNTAGTYFPNGVTTGTPAGTPGTYTGANSTFVYDPNLKITP